VSTPEKQRTAADDDAALLHKLGYAQVLYREMGGFSNFAISFTIISILAGCLTSYYIAFNAGGPVAITWGWLLCGVFCVLIAMAMGEIASAMPTAGALYYWASKLGGPAWGWFTGWFNLIGQIAVTASIDFGAATFTTALLNLWFPDAIGNDTNAIFITFTVIMALHLALNLLNINLLALLNTVSAWWHMAGVVVIVLVLIAVPERHQSAAYVFGETINNSGFSGTGFGELGFWFVFGLGLVMSMYTITGYDASAHMSEETRSASRSAALGMVMAVAVSVVFGFILLVAVTYAIPFTPDGLPDNTGVALGGGTADKPAAANAVVYIWTTSLGNVWTEFLLVIAVVAQFFCGTASVTSASRMMFAFSRDRAVPFSTLWRKVSANRVPTNAVIAIVALSWLLMLPSLFSVIAYLVATSIAVVGLYIAFALPIYLRIRAGESFESGAWTLGAHYKWVSPLAVIWIVIVCILFLAPISPKGIPGADDFDPTLVNYAPLTVGAALILFGGWYLLSAKNWFTGPVRENTASIEEALEAEAHTSSTGTAAAAATGAAATAAAGTVTMEKTDSAEPATVAEPETAVEPETTAVAEPDAVAEAEPETAVVAEPETAVVAEPETAVVAEPETAVVAEPETAVVAEPEAAEAEPETAAVAEPEPAAEVESEAAAVAEPEKAAATEPEKAEASAGSTSDSSSDSSVASESSTASATESS
jgi:amino acid transporter